MGKTPPPFNEDAANDGPDDTKGDAAWRRLKAATKPLAEPLKNRHVEARSARRTAKPKRVDHKPAAFIAEKNTALAGQGVRPTKADTAKPPPRFGLEQKAKRRLARGHMEIDARLDLHGMTLAEAHRSLIGFVSSAVAQEKKWLLVITGKGMRGEGKLRRALPEWLSGPPLAQQIAEYGASAPNHGGDGAFYLRLRKSARP